MDDGQLLQELRGAVRAGCAPPPQLRRELAGIGDPMLARRAGLALAGLRTADTGPTSAAGRNRRAGRGVQVEDRAGQTGQTGQTGPASAAGRNGAGPDEGALRPLRVTVLATCTVGPLEPLLRTTLVGSGVLPAIELAGYRAFDLALAGGALGHDGADPDHDRTGAATGTGHNGTGHNGTSHNGTSHNGAGTGLDGGGPELVACLLDEAYFLPPQWSPAEHGALVAHLRGRLDELGQLVAAGLRHTTATLVLHTVPLPVEVLDTHLSLRARAAVARAWHELNAGLLALAERHRQVVVVDLVTALAAEPHPARDRRLHRYADLPYTDGALLVLARLVARVAQAMAGLSRKVLALDLDNTLWGGVLGEVGGPGVQLGGLYPGNCYQQLQRSVRRLREQGVVLVLASKNDAALVTQTLAEHPAALLRPDAFAVTAVNWAAKAENLRRAADTLGLGVQSFVFMDDSAFERGHVGTELPQVALVSAGGDPANLEHELLRGGWFDVMELTDTDRQRPALYRSRAMRGDFATGFGSSRDYLRALGVQVLAEPVTGYTVARVAQLAARTNQFNLTGLRFDEAATAALSTDPDHLVASFAVSDRFGDEGIAGALWVRRDGPVWQVRNAVLSCRVLGRGVELAMAGWLVARAAAAGAAAVRGRFVPSGRNAVAADFWARAGFAPTAESGVFELVLDGASRPAGEAVAAEAGITPEWVRLRERSGA